MNSHPAMSQEEEEQWLTATAKDYLDKKYGAVETKKLGDRLAGGAKEKWYQDMSFKNRYIRYEENGNQTDGPQEFSESEDVPDMLTILCWNTNGLVTNGKKWKIIRNKFGKKFEADVILLSETHRMDVKGITPEGYTSYCLPTIIGASGRPQRGLVIFCRTETVGGNFRLATYFPVDKTYPQMEYIALDFRVGKSKHVHRVVLIYCESSFGKTNLASKLKNIVDEAPSDVNFIHILGDLNVPRATAEELVEGIKGMYPLLKATWATNVHGNQIDHILSIPNPNEKNLEQDLKSHVMAHKPINPYGDKGANDHLVLYLEIGNDVNSEKNYFCDSLYCPLNCTED